MEQKETIFQVSFDAFHQKTFQVEVPHNIACILESLGQTHIICEWERRGEKMDSFLLEFSKSSGTPLLGGDGWESVIPSVTLEEFSIHLSLTVAKGIGSLKLLGIEGDEASSDSETETEADPVHETETEADPVHVTRLDALVKVAQMNSDSLIKERLAKLATLVKLTTDDAWEESISAWDKAKKAIDAVMTATRHAATVSNLWKRSLLAMSKAEDACEKATFSVNMMERAVAKAEEAKDLDLTEITENNLTRAAAGAPAVEQVARAILKRTEASRLRYNAMRIRVASHVQNSLEAAQDSVAEALRHSKKVQQDLMADI